MKSSDFKCRFISLIAMLFVSFGPHIFALSKSEIIETLKLGASDINKKLPKAIDDNLLWESVRFYQHGLLENTPELVYHYKFTSFDEASLPDEAISEFRSELKSLTQSSMRDGFDEISGENLKSINLGVSYVLYNNRDQIILVLNFPATFIFPLSVSERIDILMDKVRKAYKSLPDESCDSGTSQAYTLKKKSIILRLKDVAITINKDLPEEVCDGLLWSSLKYQEWGTNNLRFVYTCVFNDINSFSDKEAAGIRESIKDHFQSMLKNGFSDIALEELQSVDFEILINFYRVRRRQRILEICLSVSELFPNVGTQ